MMIARRLRVSQWLLLILLVATQPQAQAQYANPHYQGSAQRGTPSQHSAPSAQTVDANGSNQHTGDSAIPEIQLSFDLPVALGDAGQGLRPKLGLSAQIYLAPMIDPNVKNFISLGYESFTLKADVNSSFRLFPVLAGLEFTGRPDATLEPTFALALGGAYAYIAVPNSQVYSGKGYFCAQARPGLSLNLDGFSLVAQTPVNFVFSTTKLSFINYTLGAKFKL